MAVSSVRGVVTLKEKGHFEHNNENERYDKYTLADKLPAQLSALRLQRVMQPAWSVRTLTPDDKQAVLDFLRRFFFRDEPMNLAVDLLNTPNGRCYELEEYAASTLDDGVSVAVVDNTGAIVGIIVNGIVERKELDSTDKTEDCPNPKFKRILKVLSHLDREARVWDKLSDSCSKVLEIRIASTHPDWRGRGLMRVMCEESERIAKKMGASAMRMDATSSFSAAVAERLQYKRIYQIKYKDMPFAPQPSPPHLQASVYIKPL